MKVMPGKYINKSAEFLTRGIVIAALSIGAVVFLIVCIRFWSHAIAFVLGAAVYKLLCD